MSAKINETMNESLQRLPFQIALANKFLVEIGFVEIIDSAIDWDPKQWTLSPGYLAKAVILSTFFDMKSPITHVAERFIGIDIDYLFGEGTKLSDLKAQAIGRALERIATKNPTELFKTLSLNAYSVYNLSFNKLHSDTTTVSFYGDYESEESDENEPLNIIRGYNKDGRPLDNQVVIGKITNEHGIPLVSQVLDGNTSDVDWNKEALEHLQDVFKKMGNLGVYVADCKLITSDLVRLMTDPENPVQFVSRCPAQFHKKLEKRMIEKALEDNNWIELGQISSKKKSCSYLGCEYDVEFEGRLLKAVVIKSSEGTARYEDKLTKEKEKLFNAITQVTKKDFKCEADALKELDRFRKTNNKTNLFQLKMEVTENRIEKNPVGKPGKDPKPPKVIFQYGLKIEMVGTSEPERKSFQAAEECFVLLTNVVNLSPFEALSIYKNQMVVEIEFRYYKEPCLASVIYLKNPDRVKALLMILSVSLMIRGLIQYQMRVGYKKADGNLPRVGHNKAKLTNPTYKILYDAIKNNFFKRLGKDEYDYFFYDDFNRLQVTTLLSLMGLSVVQLLC